MKIFKCDHCGKEEPAKEGEDYAENWDSVTISTSFHYHVCEACGRELFIFFKAV